MPKNKKIVSHSAHVVNALVETKRNHVSKNLQKTDFSVTFIKIADPTFASISTTTQETHTDKHSFLYIRIN